MPPDPTFAWPKGLPKGVRDKGLGFYGWPSSAEGLVLVYNAGAEFASVTGGWQIGFNAGCTLAKGASSLNLTSPNSNSTYGTITTSGKIDLTPYKYLFADTTSSDVAYQSMITAGTVLGDNARYDPFRQNRAEVTGYQQLVLDVSSANGLYYLRAHIDGANFGVTGGNMQVTKMWLTA